jgi:hypothetical protein
MAHSVVDFVYDRIKDGLMFLPLALRQISLLGATMMTSRMASALALCILFSQGIALAKGTAAPKRHKITMAAAQKIALEREAGTVKSGEREKEKGKLIYSFDIQMPDGIHEVNVDAYSGEVLEDHVESPADEAKEKAQEKKN